MNNFLDNLVIHEKRQKGGGCHFILLSSQRGSRRIFSGNDENGFSIANNKQIETIDSICFLQTSKKVGGANKIKVNTALSTQHTQGA